MGQITGKSGIKLIYNYRDIMLTYIHLTHQRRSWDMFIYVSQELTWTFCTSRFSGISYTSQYPTFAGKTAFIAN